ncbi:MULTISPECIES: hypothetical protein [unclassified Microcoleus]|uniref:hypothetical protein n=1 Tax=unclassified Microcoleus TaxID=2642155 RepID=UPI002FCF49CA
MSQSQVVSFRASGHFLNWIEAQRLEGESVSQAAQRILKEISGVYGNYKLYTTSGNPVSTSSDDVSTPPAEVSTTNSHDVVSTNIVDIVDKAVSSSLDPVMERMAAIEERLGKLSA